jgi:hypothetical protein
VRLVGNARFSERFDLDTLEATVNSYAQQGWRVTDVEAGVRQSVCLLR